MAGDLVIVAGFGFRAAASADSLAKALKLAAPDQPVTALATSRDKAQAPCLTTLAGALVLPIIPVGVAAIRAARTTTRSPRVERARATGSLAEATALAAAGPGARLLCPRRISPDRLAACAIAIGADP